MKAADLISTFEAKAMALWKDYKCMRWIKATIFRRLLIIPLSACCCFSRYGSLQVVSLKIQLLHIERQCFWSHYGAVVDLQITVVIQFEQSCNVFALNESVVHK